MKKVLILSGAGISAESGIRTFRDADGLWVKDKIFMNNVVKIEIDKQMIARQIEALRNEKVKLYSLDEAEKILDEALARYEILIQSAKKIAKSAKEEYDLLNG